MMRTFSLRSISSRSASLMASRYVFWAMVHLFGDEHVVAQLARVGRGAVLGEPDRLLHLGFDLVPDLPQLGFRRQVVLLHSAAPARDRLAGLRLYHFLLGPVPLRIPHRVPAKTVLHRLDQLRPAAVPGLVCHPAHGVPYGEDVVSVDSNRRNIEGGRFPVY